MLLCGKMMAKQRISAQSLEIGLYMASEPKPLHPSARRIFQKVWLSCEWNHPASQWTLQWLDSKMNGILHIYFTAGSMLIQNVWSVHFSGILQSVWFSSSKNPAGLRSGPIISVSVPSFLLLLVFLAWKCHRVSSTYADEVQRDDKVNSGPR